LRKGEVSVSPKGHCNLSGIRTQDHTFYLGTEDADGTIHLIPAALVPARLLLPPERGHGVIETVREDYKPGKDPGSYYHEKSDGS
jgi:hypothetical protein